MAVIDEASPLPEDTTPPAHGGDEQSQEDLQQDQAKEFTVPEPVEKIESIPEQQQPEEQLSTVIKEKTPEPEKVSVSTVQENIAMLNEGVNNPKKIKGKARKLSGAMAKKLKRVLRKGQYKITPHLLTC